MRTLRHSRSAIASLVSPSATSSRTSSSRGLSGRHGRRRGRRLRAEEGAELGPERPATPARRPAGCGSPTPAGRTGRPGCGRRAAGPPRPARRGRLARAATSVGAVTRAATSTTSMRLRASYSRTAVAAEVERRCSSSYHAICSAVPCGRNSMLNRRRNAGFASVQPARIAEIIASACGALLRAAPHPAPRVAPVEDEVGDPLGMPRRVDERDRGPLRDAEQREAIEARRVDDASRGRRPTSRRRARRARGRRARTRARRSGRACGPSPSSASQWRHTGLSQSKSRCVNQVAARTIGGPRPWTA